MLSDCLAPADAAARTVHAVRPDGLAAFLASLPDPQRHFLAQAGFAARVGQVALLPGADGIAAAVVGDDGTPWALGGLPAFLPAGTAWRIAGADPARATLGFCLGAYRYDRFRTAPPTALLAGADPAATATAAVLWNVRDLINAPANALGPAELADAARQAGTRIGATVEVLGGAALAAAYPALDAVGRGSARAPQVAILRWRGSAAGDKAPLVSICGKGVCFDSGGYDLKPGAAMLNMKKDMAGAALALGLAELVAAADLPIRLEVRLGCVENMVSGTAFRPRDVLATRAGLTVEVGNTDAEGRLVLCDLLAEAVAAEPALLLDFATLTGAARVALGPDLPALFCNDSTLATALQAAGDAAWDPSWRLPLHDGYAPWLDSKVADSGTVAARPMAGAIVAALFLRQFVPARVHWAHYDVYAWNDSDRPGRPEGGEAQAIRGILKAITERFAAS